MIRIEFREEDIEKLAYERIHHSHHRVRQKMEAVYLKSKGYSHKQIQSICGISGNTLRAYLRDFKKGGIEKLKEINFYRPKSELEEYRDMLKEYFLENPFSTINEAISKIEELTGIGRSPTQIAKFLKSLGITRKKVGTVPEKADPEKQEEFIETELEPRLEEAKENKRVVLFMDASHFVFQAFLGFLWCFKRVFIKSPSGRKRFNVLGAINAITHEVITFTNLSYINALSVCELLREIASRYMHLPITIVLDNARYQKCALVQELAKSLNIELLYLPSYSPNLNLIERLWKFVKKKCLYSKYYKDFTLFKESILCCLNKTQTEYKKELDSLLSLKFQTFSKVQVMAL